MNRLVLLFTFVLLACSETPTITSPMRSLTQIKPQPEYCVWLVIANPTDWIAVEQDERGECVWPDLMNGMPYGPDWIITKDANDRLEWQWDTTNVVPKITCLSGDCN